MALDPTAPIAEKAWLRMADLYFQAEHYEDAKRCYEGLLANFEGSAAVATAQLRLAQCEFNSGRDAEALENLRRALDIWEPADQDFIPATKAREALAQWQASSS